jgi:hypothetical protein
MNENYLSNKVIGLSIEIHKTLGLKILTLNAYILKFYGQD